MVNPYQHSLDAALSRTLTVGIVPDTTLFAGILIVRILNQAMLRPVSDLTAWAEDVIESRNLTVPGAARRRS